MEQGRAQIGTGRAQIGTEASINWNDFARAPHPEATYFHPPKAQHNAQVILSNFYGYGLRYFFGILALDLWKIHPAKVVD